MSRARSAQGKAHAEFPLARAGARQHEIGEIRASASALAANLGWKDSVSTPLR
jgi:hypothetical protein